VSKKLRLTISAVLLAWVACRTEWEAVARAFVNMRLELWLAAVGVLLVAQVVSAWRWQMLARPFGFECGVGQLTSFYLIGMYFNLLLPTSVGGDVVRAWYLDGGSGRRLVAFVAVLLDRMSGLVVLLTLALVAWFLSPLDLPAWIGWFVVGTTACGALGIILAPWLARRSQRFSRQIGNVSLALAALRSPRLLAGSTALSLGVQSANVVLVWLIGLAIGAEVPAGYYWILVPMVSLLTMLPVSINGVGMRENAMVFFLAPLGVAEATAVPLALLWFAVFLAVSLVGGVVYLVGPFQRPVVQTEAEDGSVGSGADQGRARQPRSAA